MASTDNSTNIIVEQMLKSLFDIATGSIVKIKEIADKHETAESARRGDLLKMAVENRGDFFDYNYTYSVLLSAGLSEDIAATGVNDKSTIPEAYRAEVLRLQREYIIANHEELNDYYRMLNGIPNYGDSSLYIKYAIVGVDISKPVHLYTVPELTMAESSGYLQELRDKNPTKKYLNYLGVKKINVYAARKAINFDILYLPNVTSESIKQNFRKFYYQQRNYFVSTAYSSAYNDSDNYAGFVGMVILFGTVQRVIAENIRAGIARDFYDSISIKNIFQSFGVDYFENIPIIYQRRLVKNLNTLLKYKSTDRVIVDICSLFGYDNVEVFKYYLLKDHKKDSNGDFVFSYTTDAQGNQVKHLDEMYELKFLQVSIEEDNVDTAIKNNTRVIEYDEMTESDPYWGAGIGKDVLKQEILAKEFNIEETKYMSINSMYDITKLSFELNYFFDMVKKLKDDETALLMRVSAVNPNLTFRLFDVTIALYALICEKHGYTGNIVDSPTAIGSILGFNFQADIAALSQYTINNGFNPNRFRLSNFVTTTEAILTPAQLVNVFFTNKGVLTYLQNIILNTADIKEYTVHKYIYDTLRITETTNEIYRKSDGEMATSFMDYLSTESPVIHELFLDIFADENKIHRINTMIDELLMSLEDYAGSQQFTYLFSNIPSSSDLVKQYIFQVINYFKSYTVDLTSINITYDFKDKVSQTLKLIDKLNRTLSNKDFKESMTSVDKAIIQKYVNKTSLMTILDKLSLEIQLNTKDILEQLDKIYYDKVLEENSILKASFADRLFMSANMISGDTVNMTDIIDIIR